MQNYISGLTVNLIEPTVFKWVFIHGEYYVNCNYANEFRVAVYKHLLEMCPRDHFNHIPNLIES